MLAIIFALISYLGWGTGDIFGTIASRKIGGYSTAFWYVLLSFILYLPFAYFFWDSLRYITLTLLVFNLILGIIGTLGMAAFYEALRISNASLVGAISASFASVTVILSIIFLGERITIIQAIAIITIFSGIVASILNLEELRNKKKVFDMGIFLALAAMLLWGVYWTFIKIPILKIGWFWPSVIAASTFPILLPIMKIRKIKLVSPSQNHALFPLITNAVLLGGSALTFNFAISKGLISVVAPIAGSYPTLFVALAFFIFKDPITKQQIVGIITTLVGIVLLSINSV